MQLRDIRIQMRSFGSLVLLGHQIASCVPCMPFSGLQDSGAARHLRGMQTTIWRKDGVRHVQVFLHVMCAVQRRRLLFEASNVVWSVPRTPRTNAAGSGTELDKALRQMSITRWPCCRQIPITLSRFLRALSVWLTSCISSADAEYEMCSQSEV